MQAAAKLEGIVKAEILARKESVKQLRAESLQKTEHMHASMLKVDKKMEVTLGAQRLLREHHEALQVHAQDNILDLFHCMQMYVVEQAVG
jgi:hypothetical protein